MEDEPGAAEHRPEERRDGSRHLSKLAEDEHLLLPGRDDLRDVPQARPLAAVYLGPRTVAKPLRRVVADLLEPHQERQDEALAPDALGELELRGHFLDGLLIER